MLKSDQHTCQENVNSVN